MSWFQANKRSAWVIALTLLVPLVVYLYALINLVSVRQTYQSDIDRLSPRIARLQGLIDNQAALSVSAEQADRLMVDLVYPVTEDRAAVAARLQQNIRQLLDEAGLSVSNSQVLPVREVELFDYIGLKLTVTGNVDSLDAGLATLLSHRPLLLVESLEIWPNRSNRRKKKDEQELQSLSATLQLLSLRAVQ